MKSLFIAIALILAVILAMGGLSSLSGNLSDVVSTTAAGTTAKGEVNPSDNPSDLNVTIYPYGVTDIPFIDTTSVSSYLPGTGYSSDQDGVSLVWGLTKNESADDAILAIQLSGLTVGNEYLLEFNSWDNTLDHYLCYRFTSSGKFVPFDLDSFVETFTIRFKASTSIITIGLVKFSNISELSEESYSSLVQANLSLLKDTISFKFYEVIS